MRALLPARLGRNANPYCGRLARQAEMYIAYERVIAEADCLRLGNRDRWRPLGRSSHSASCLLVIAADKAPA